MPHDPRGHSHGEAIEGRHSRGYDRMARLLMKPLYRRIAKDVAASAPQGATLLDVGTGPGILLAALGPMRPDLRFVGVDLSADMIDHARRNLADLRDRLELHAADVASLPLDDGRFDLVVSTYSSHHWGDPEAGAAEIARVLRRGGRFVDYDFPRAPFDALTRRSGLDRVRATRFKTGLGPLMKTLRFEAAAS
ncbi:class I SAM-dependent methyltransferase [Glycomyces sp. TRM65418]|uniref:class I SAM-dependent methyltransferase n=1 Tax=Glycomyces sp. TRM65418 TaxID=2867006 RepID=UPI001CE6A22D|nr:class I SAM-dependent methyltransferase [Glycomyces sp. TRM65418]MCC3765617.1 class I SAM-dependent methyltransferase [Glycomyces sp. TRM65418]QZD55216.1 class I SAM-dependent methyltransferase [Glycomyces sp. TRM65418]